MLARIKHTPEYICFEISYGFMISYLMGGPFAVGQSAQHIGIGDVQRRRQQVAGQADEFVERHLSLRDPEKQSVRHWKCQFSETTTPTWN